MFEKNNIYCADALQAIKKVAAGTMDIVVTDPPYGLKKEGITNDDDLSVFYAMLPECYRVLKDDAFFITFFSTKYIPDLFKHNPFEYFWQCILHCPSGSVQSKIGYTKYMAVFVFKKGNPKLVKMSKDIFMDSPGKMVEPLEGFIDHPTPKPTAFIRELLAMFSKPHDLVFDPFAGSGSTLVAAKEMGRQYLGFEIEADYVALAKQRLSKREKNLTNYFPLSKSSEVQKHGFVFEEWVKTVLGVESLASQYTQKWDVPGELPISVKCMGLRNAVEFGSTVRFWSIDRPFLLVIGRWEQVGDHKVIKSIDEIRITPEVLAKLRGDISLDEIKAFDEKIKRFPPGKAGQQEGIAFAKAWKRARKDRMGLLTITHKIDSKDQRRIQCNLNYKQYVSLFGAPAKTPVFRGKTFDQLIGLGPRTFKKT